MSNINLNFTGLSAFNGGWLGYGQNAGYFGSNSTNNYASALRFEAPEGGSIKKLTLTISAAKGFSGGAAAANFFCSVTYNEPAATGDYIGDAAGPDDGQIYSAARSVTGLTDNAQSYVIDIDVNAALIPGQPVYIVLSANRAAGNGFGQLFRDGCSCVAVLNDSAPDAPVVISPAADVLLNTEDILFSWRHNDPAGNPQTAWQIIIADTPDGYGISFNDTTPDQFFRLKNVESILDTGLKYWRVRTQNVNGWSGYSAPMLFTLVGASPVETLAVTGQTWRPIIKWVASGQELAEVSIDGHAETVFGPVYEFKAPDILRNGEHEVTVRVQNQYGFWSRKSFKWRADNPGGEPITLTVTKNVNGSAINVNFFSPEKYDAFVVYRNGIPIKRLNRRRQLIDGWNPSTVSAGTGFSFDGRTARVRVETAGTYKYAQWRISCTAGQPYTLSCGAITSSGTDRRRVSVLDKSAYVILLPDGKTYAHCYENQSITFIPPDDSFIVRIALNSTTSVDAGAYVYVSDIMLEEGEVAHPWEEYDPRPAFSFADYFSIGQTEYTVRGIAADHYSAATGIIDAVPQTVTIYDIDDQRLMRLQLSTTQTRVNSSSKLLGMSSAHYAGRRYPVPTVNGFEDISIETNTAFADRFEAREFERFYGKMVCLKTPGEDMVIGIMDKLSKSADEMIVNYSVSVSQSDWREEIDIDTGDLI